MTFRQDLFSRKPVRWADLKPVLNGVLQSASGGQGKIFALDDRYEGVVAKLYHRPRDGRELKRVRGLITVCRTADESSLATQIFLQRLNLPLRPVVGSENEFVGVLLPPLPDKVLIAEHRFDSAAGKLTARLEKIKFQAQYLLRDESVAGYANEAWRWRVAYSLTETVATMHSANLVHGDLSLDNVLVQKVNDSGYNDVVYLIDVDDAFNVAPGRPTTTAVRKSKHFHDPDSVRAEKLSKGTDVFVVALWTVSLMNGGVVSAPSFVQDRQIPPQARRRIEQRSPELLRRIERALGPLERGRPSAAELLEVMPLVGDRYAMLA